MKQETGENYTIISIIAVYHYGYQTKKNMMEWEMINAQATDVTAPNLRDVQP